jgi:hypothetical protein
MYNKCIIIFGDTTYIYRAVRKKYLREKPLHKWNPWKFSFIFKYSKLFDLTDGSTTVDSKMVETGVHWKQWAVTKLLFAERFLAVYG